MRTFALLLALSALGCGQAGPAVLIPCGTGGTTCDVGSGAACCISTGATCTKSACQGPAFTCTTTRDCDSGKLCCLNQLGSICATTCDSSSSQACATNDDCKNLSGQTCTGGTRFNDQSGAILFTISYCVL